MVDRGQRSESDGMTSRSRTGRSTSGSSPQEETASGSPIGASKPTEKTSLLKVFDWKNSMPPSIYMFVNTTGERVSVRVKDYTQESVENKRIEC